MLAELLELLLLRRISGRGRALQDQIRRFYKPPGWKRLRYAHLVKSPACLACGRSACDGARMNVDYKGAC